MRALLLILLLSVSGSTMGFQAQNEYTNTSFYDVPEIKSPGGKKVKNIILMIGDGMGVAQVQAAFIANNGQLNIQNCPVTGFSKTSSSDNLTTDSAAAATSMACGVKTYNGAIGVDENGNSVKTILEIAIQNGMKTGLVATCKITHATPASFIAHESTRDRYKEIAKDFLDTPIDVFIGGGRSDFDTATNGVKLLDQLVQKKYAVVTDIDSLQYISSGKLAGLIHENNQPNMLNGRGDMLSIATKKALELLDNKKGFFLMIEGSQIDWG